MPIECGRNCLNDGAALFAGYRTTIPVQAVRIGSGSAAPGQELPSGKWTIVLEYDGDEAGRFPYCAGWPSQWPGTPLPLA